MLQGVFASVIAMTKSPGLGSGARAEFRRCGGYAIPAPYGQIPRAALHCRASMISTLDTHELVKDLKASGFTDDQAEAVTRAVRLARDFDLSSLATKIDISDLRREIAEVELRLIKWVIGVGIAAVLAVGGMIWTATQILLRAHL
jgi:hypothetical protein